MSNSQTMEDWDNGPDMIPDAPDTDHFGQDVEVIENVHPSGAGEKGQCTVCGASRHFIAMYAATVPSEKDHSNDWEEYYVCECGATGKLRSEFTDHTQTYEWHGSIEYPDE